MGEESDDVAAAIDAALGAYRRHPDVPSVAPPADDALSHQFRTEFSATLFSGDPVRWVRYLTLPGRYEPEASVAVDLHGDGDLIRFRPQGDDSTWLAAVLTEGVRHTRKSLKRKPHAALALSQLLFESGLSGEAAVLIHLSRHVPALSTREVRQGTEPPGQVRIVLHEGGALAAREALSAGALLSAGVRLGLCWSLVNQFISHVAFPQEPEDRFVAKIEVFAKLAFVALNVLYQEQQGGRLLATPTGRVFEMLVSESTGIGRKSLHDRHPYFRMLRKIGFALRARPYQEYATELRIAAREFLDAGYLKLSLSGAMPEPAENMRPMPIPGKPGKIRSPRSLVGRYGVMDLEDQDAWKQVERPFLDLGFILLRQVGIGDFGRVYEAHNLHSPSYPQRVALKVDRIQGKKKRAILEAEEAMEIGRDLASSPHLVRLYDTGKLSGQRFTYHVLQFIDGDTLDSLLGATGLEHTSIRRGPTSARSAAQVLAEAYRRMTGRSSYAGPRERKGLPFRFALSPAMLLDLISSILLCIQEVHSTGYAINDLKNDNLMISRRGQIKGIDLDSFSVARTTTDKITDFLYLSSCLVLVLLHAPNHGQPGPPQGWEPFTQDERLLRQQIQSAWGSDSLEALSQGRVSGEELTDVLVRLVRRSADLTYAGEPETFAADIARLLHIKRRLLLEDLVID